MLYWFDNFAWALDPRRDPSELPLLLYDGKQLEYLMTLEALLDKPEDVFIDKPRDVGATVILMNWLLYHWLFDDGFNARVGSRKEDYVDKRGDPDTLFFKLDYTLERIPQWMMPEGWKSRKDRSHLLLKRPDNSNTISGESANPSFARGGRQTIVVFDEMGFWPFARPAWQSAGDVTDVRVAMTTPPDTGKQSFAYKLLTGKEGRVRVFGFDFNDIPWKDDQWILDQRQRRSDEEFNREVMKSYVGSPVGKVYLTQWEQWVDVGDHVEYRPHLPLYVAWDMGLDMTAMIWFQKDFSINHVYIIDSYYNTNKPDDFYVPFILGSIPSFVGPDGEPVFYEYNDEDFGKIELHNTWRKDITHFSDPDARNRNRQTGKSTKQRMYEKWGIYMQSKPWAGRSHKELKNKTELLFRRLHVRETGNEFLIESVISAKYPQRNEGSQSTTPITKPVHDDTSHFRTALEYYADNEPDDTRVADRKRLSKKKPVKSYRPNFHI